MPRIPSPARARHLFVALLLACLLPLAGCHKQTELPPTHPAAGKVVYEDGTPMKGGSIQFLSLSPDSKIVTSGEIDENGSFKLYTLQDKTKAAGAVEGQYQVTILPPQGDDHRPVRPIMLPGTYTIKPGENTFPAMTVPRPSR